MTGFLGLTLNELTWVIAATSTAGVILRPFRWPEAVWAVTGAVLLICLRLLSPEAALAGVGKGLDVYLFLIGMMVLSELAREHGLFDWLAAYATRHAAGSASRLFLLIYGVGVIVTVFLSNDATAVVLTPAVAAAARSAKVSSPLPYLLICAFIANAASFVLPISNPANLVIYGAHMPTLLQWLPRFGPASVVAIVITYVVLRWTQAAHLRQPIATDIPLPRLSTGAKAAACGIIATGVLLLGCSALGLQLGLPTFIAGGLAAIGTLTLERQPPWPILKGISWGVLPLVAGLFVLVEALNETGVTIWLASVMNQLREHPAGGPFALGTALAFICNVMNNLPAGLLAGSAVEAGNVPDSLRSAILIGVDLGPNLSVTGSLATILWLNALRREGLHVGAWSFLKIGMLVMPPALLLALAVTILLG
ncbi:MAG: arsenic transporter [Rhizobiales bacterium]|nr:arsenic transporter [Hyphomicrobiales bacterium]OJY05044.1 MAG: arsenic transporter [Rhizobiales bacterium 63-22]